MARQRKRRGRQVNGIVLLDKPAGISSNHALQRVKRMYDANKAGHTGSLDVPASGLLPLCLGEATKVSAFLLDADKTYIARGRLGITTTTGDAAGEVLAQKDVPDVSSAQLKSVLSKYTGKIEQIPPMFSALKHNGKRLYELAYQGIEVERKARTISIYELVLIEKTDTEFEIKVHCSKGTYIRTLVQDIGHELGCGAHTVMLRRLQSGPFFESQMLSLEALEQTAQKGHAELDALLMPMDTALSHLPSVTLSADVAHYLCQGQAVMVPGVPNSGSLRIYHESDDFLGIGEATGDGRVAPKRMININ
jgi:tRNA pseudouridine55 synthase